MGRFEKTIVIDNGLDRRELGYYSTPSFISTFMTKKMLSLNPNGKIALDPCVGKEEMIKEFYNSNIEIDGIDIHNHGDHFYCNFIEDDFIDYYKRNKIGLLFDQKINLEYDYYIANPPYNCHEVDYIKSNKKVLNNIFGSIGVHNMYSMFTSAIIDSAKDGALISIICADSFLNSSEPAAAFLNSFLSSLSSAILPAAALPIPATSSLVLFASAVACVESVFISTTTLVFLVAMFLLF
jgi:hypothetical protein